MLFIIFFSLPVRAWLAQKHNLFSVGVGIVCLVMLKKKSSVIFSASMLHNGLWIFFWYPSQYSTKTKQKENVTPHSHAGFSSRQFCATVRLRVFYLLVWMSEKKLGTRRVLWCLQGAHDLIRCVVFYTYFISEKNVSYCFNYFCPPPHIIYSFQILHLSVYFFG